MKYSVLYPYYKRSGHLHNTFISFLYHYSDRDDYEVIIAEDFKNIADEKEHSALLRIIEQFKSQINIIHISIPVETWNPCIAFNSAAEIAEGDYYIISNPECFHQSNILRGMDEEFAKDSSIYIVCASRNYLKCRFFINTFEELEGKEGAWFSHSIYRPARLHFCNGLSKESWLKIGGFDEDYKNGVAYDDNDFINRISRAKLKIIDRDDLLTIHIDHGPAHANSVKREELMKINWEIFSRKWK